MKNSHTSPLLVISLIIGDIAALLLSYSLAYIIRVKISDTPVSTYIPAEPYFLSLVFILPVIILFFTIIGSYRRIGTQKRYSQILRIITGACAAMVILITIDYFYNAPIFPAKLVPLYGFILSVIFISLSRVVIYGARRLWLKRGKSLRSVIIIGDDIATQNLIEEVSKRNSGYKIVAVVGNMRLRFTTHKTFQAAVQSKEVSSPDLIIQIATKDNARIDEDVLQYAIEHYAEFKFIPNETSETLGLTTLELFMDSIPVLDIRQTSLNNWGQIVKRITDIVVSTTMIIIASPLFLIISVVNRLVFGKVFFHQERLTRGYKSFQLFKFQTVRKDLNGLTPEEAFIKIGKPELIKTYRKNGDYLPHDPRYGAWSRFLRKTSLDELPQLWNILRGDISLVGPRALIPQELDNYDKKHLILSVKSGLTGLAQTSGRRSLPWDQRRNLDIYYVRNWSLGLDFQILLKTIWQVLTRRGAE